MYVHNGGAKMHRTTVDLPEEMIKKCKDPGIMVSHLCRRSLDNLESLRFERKKVADLEIENANLQRKIERLVKKLEEMVTCSTGSM
jgi:sialic acid synthase SpsE